MEIIREQHSLLGNLVKKRTRIFSARPETVKFRIAGVDGKINVFGDFKETLAKTLIEYFADFTVDSNYTSRFEINYYCDNLKNTSLKDEIWNGPFEEFDVFPKDNTFHIIQRDFIAFSNQDFSSIWAQGPKFEIESMDSIDNLVMVTMGNHLINYNALALHAATVVKDGGAYVFYGQSGAGKSTLAAQSFELDGLQVLSGDQIYLRQVNGKLYACANSTTIPDFPRSHPAWSPKEYQIRALINLSNEKREYQYKPFQKSEALKYFMKEVIYWKEMAKPSLLLKTCLEFISNEHIILGRMTYKKDDSFWKRLIRDLE